MLIKKRLQHRCFPVKICEIFKNTYFEEHLKGMIKTTSFSNFHCVKSVQYRDFSGPYFPVFRLFTRCLAQYVGLFCFIELNKNFFSRKQVNTYFLKPQRINKSQMLHHGGFSEFSAIPSRVFPTFLISSGK